MERDASTPSAAFPNMQSSQRLSSPSHQACQDVAVWSVLASSLSRFGGRVEHKSLMIGAEVLPADIVAHDDMTTMFGRCAGA